MRCRCHLLGIAVFLLMLLPGDRSGRRDGFAQGTPSGTRRALLIGINDYRDPRIHDLRGPVNDTRTMQQILLSRYGFPPENIRLLHDSAATRKGILSALTLLRSRTGPGDLVMIQFSGHGSRVKDRNGDEPDGFDETIVPCDGRTTGVADITDDELATLLGGFRAKDIVVLLDSCHSGTATRSLMVTTRSIPPDTREDLYAAGGGGGQSREIVAVLGARHALFTGAADNQSAIDAPIGGRYHGIFTYSLGRAVARLPGNPSIRRLMAETGREMRKLRAEVGLTNLPEPQLEAPRERLDGPLFPVSAGGGGAGAPAVGASHPWVTVQPRGPGSKEVTLIGAASLGGRAGSVWAVHRPGETEFRPGEAIARATVVLESGDDAVARLEPPNALVPGGSRAVLLMASGSAESTPIRLLNFDEVSRSILLEALRRRGASVVVVEGAGYARFVVELRGNSCILFGATGTDRIDAYPSSDLRAAAERIATIVGRSDAAAQLTSLDNPSTSIRLEARLVTAAGTASTREISLGADRGVQVVPTVGESEYRVKGDLDPRTLRNSLMIEISASVDCYLTIVDVDSQGGVNLLFPNSYQNPQFHPQGRIQGGRTVRIPDSLADDNRAGFCWDIFAPGGQDTVRIFATGDLATATTIRSLAASAERNGSSASGEALAGLRRGLGRAVKARPTGSGQTGGPTGDWAATSVEFMVRE